jgi:hypothetical protein
VFPSLDMDVSLGVKSSIGIWEVLCRVLYHLDYSSDFQIIYSTILA